MHSIDGEVEELLDRRRATAERAGFASQQPRRCVTSSALPLCFAKAVTEPMHVFVL